MMVSKWVTATVVILILLLFNITICGADAEENITSSAEEIAAFWKSLLSDNLDIVLYSPEMRYWEVNRIVMVPKSFRFDILKTDSSDTPYQLKIRFSFNRWHNRHSQHANSDYEYEHRSVGFKTADDAMANIEDADFEEAKYSYIEQISRQMTMTYGLNKETWILDRWNDLFETYIGQHIESEYNGYLFRNVLSVPVK